MPEQHALHVAFEDCGIGIELARQRMAGAAACDKRW
jgi:hypothetical protein